MRLIKGGHMLRKINRKDLDPEKKQKGVKKKVDELKFQLATPLPEKAKEKLRKEIKRLLSESQ
jgi:hypothetical protein